MRSRSPGLRHLLSPLTRKLETYVHPLRYLFVEITQRCNLSCLHCGSDCGRQPQLRELSTEQWLGFFRYLREEGPSQQLVLVVTGGEPFCHPEFDKIMEGLRDNRLSWGMVTNGFALSRHNVARLVDHGISSITVSLDGLRGSHDWLRGVPGSFERALAGIQHLAATDILFFDVVTCVNPRNLPELPEVMRLLREAGVPAWRLFSIFPKGRAKENPELFLSPSGWREMLGFIRDQRASLDPGSSFELSFSCEGYLPRDLDAQVRSEPYFCRAGVSIASVLCDGSISACPNISRSLVQGNIREAKLMDVWNERFERFRRRDWMKTGPCVDCAQWKRCLGNSMHLWDDEAGRTAQCTYVLLEEEPP